ncbi:MAG: CotH kinase family protein, partial [Muribaculaceae bacterium]|nr:CotH kinase family protein [Muribaculaceae bacterium]
KVPGRMTIYQRIDGVDSLMYDSGDYEKDVSGMTIKIRGNSSAYYDKKPYKIKLQKKRDLLFRGDESTYKDKDWVLLRDEYLRTMAAFKVSRMVGMVWTPAHHYVIVVLNGVYRGVYLLCESVDRNPDCRLNVDKNMGFIFECDIYWWNEAVYVNSVDSPVYNYTFKYPDEDEITPEQLAYMQWLVSAYEASLTTPRYPDWIDVTSFAAWILVHDIEGTKDGGGANRYYTKQDTTSASKIVMPVCGTSTCRSARPRIGHAVTTST